MFSLMAYVWLIIGGLLEPAWVLAMKKSKNFKDIKWTVITAFFVIASPFFLSLAMREIPVGTAYAVWTGIGAVGATFLGAILYKEPMERKRMFFIFLIIIGAVGLGLGGV
ncbi:MAG: multidrug efflux SMR transporter [Candidatus Methanoplasma sp.]|jgi:quaternary ammonium compound-resistance protein SugE|nr:multidrug efflux SMR transporter [Candidatus Methanoplasma sp.]